MKSGVGAGPVSAAVGTGLLLAASVLTAPSASADTAATSTAAGGDSLAEVVVTAERRNDTEQKVPASLVVLDGDALRAEGRISTVQILEDVPNVVYAVENPQSVAGGGNGPGDNPNGNIAIRGVLSTQVTAGIEAPSSTATYVDGVYQGIGNNYDLSRVEVLRGPQGTLYGRSATGGVVAFYTHDPVLKDFGGDAYAEFGTADLRNYTGVLNLPIGDTFAIRVAGHLQESNGFWWNPQGNYSKDEAARIKALYQPIDALKIELSASTELIELNSGGNQPTLASGPTSIDYAGVTTPVVSTSGIRYDQYSARVNYDFGAANLTYQAAMHTYGRNGFAGRQDEPSGIQSTVALVPLDQFNTQELRLASNPGGRLAWLVGGSFYSQLYDYSFAQTQDVGYEGGPGIAPGTIDPNPAAIPGTPIFQQLNRGSVKNYGLFTEETYSLSDDLRVTAGLRYDHTEVLSSEAYNFNQNLDQFLTSLSPPLNGYFSLDDYTITYNNVTYKLRGEYDLTPTNMVYGMVSTGFLPGNAQVTPAVNIINAFMGKPVTVAFKVLPFDQERLTAFEVGSKNRFLDNTLQLNGALFYYNYSGYSEAANVAPNSPIPEFITVSVPVRMYGAEFDAIWLATAADRIKLTAGVTDARIKSFPDLGAGLGSSSQYLALQQLSGVVPFSAALTYTHDVELPGGSLLVPRLQARYTGGYYLQELTALQVSGGSEPYDHQQSYGIYDVDLAWNSPGRNVAVAGYVRNIGNTIYKSYLNGGSSFTSATTVLPSPPRTYGLSVNVKF